MGAGFLNHQLAATMRLGGAASLASNLATSFVASCAFLSPWKTGDTHDPKTEYKRLLAKTMLIYTLKSGVVFGFKTHDSTSMFKIVRDLQTFPGFLVILPPPKQR